MSCRVNRVFTLLAGCRLASRSLLLLLGLGRNLGSRSLLGGSCSLGGGCRGYKHHMGRNEIVVWDERGCSHGKK